MDTKSSHDEDFFDVEEFLNGFLDEAENDTSASNQTIGETSKILRNETSSDEIVKGILNELHLELEYDRLIGVYKNKLDSVCVGRELDIVVAFITKLNKLYKNSVERLQSKRIAEQQQNKALSEKTTIEIEAEKQRKIEECRQDFAKQKGAIEAEKRKAKKKFDDVTADEIADMKISMMSKSKPRFFTSQSKKIAESQRQDEMLKEIQERRNKLFQEISRELDKKKVEVDRECEKAIVVIEHDYDVKLTVSIKTIEEHANEMDKAFVVAQNNQMQAYLCATISKFFDTDAFYNRFQFLLDIAKNSLEYSVPVVLPEYIYMYDLSYQFKADALNLIGVIRAVSKNIQKLKVLDDKGVLRVPYLIKREEGYGISAYLHSQENEDIICEFLLKQFMAFPAGKLEAVFIDPQLSAPFSSFTKLGGDDYKRVIDTKIWTSINDIENALMRARERLETLVAGYGAADKAVAEREERENFRVIAIADFPNKFSVNALRELETLVKRGPSYGISIVIFIDEAAMKNVDKNQEPYVTSILSYLELIKKEGALLSLCPKKVIDDTAPKAYDCIWTNCKSSFERDDIILQIASHVGDYRKKEVKASEIYNDHDDINSWLVKSSKDSLVIPLGTQGKGDVVNLTLGRQGADIRHHVLIEGSTGSGKSVLLHTLICSTIRLYAPNEVQLYLLDYKDGVEFKIYADYDLPSFRVVSVQSEREYGAKILDKLVMEMTERYSKFKKALDSFVEPNIEDYRNKTQEAIPRLVLIIDEFDRLTIEHDSITDKVMKNVKLLVEQGRAAGIHIILATQNFNLPSDIMDNMAVRFALQGSSHLLDSGNDGVMQLKDGPEGQVVFNDNAGKSSNNKIFQIAYLGMEKMQMLQTLSEIERDDIYREGLAETTQVLYTKIEEHKKHVINQFVRTNELPQEPLAKVDTTYPIMLGNCFDLDEKLAITLRIGAGSNLLIASERENVARNLFDLSLLSVLFDDLCCKGTDSSRQSIYYVDFGDPDKRAKSEVTQLLKSSLNDQIAYTDIDDSDEDELDESIRLTAEIIDKLYRKLCDAKNNGYNAEYRDFLFLFGVNRSHLLDSIVGTGTSSFSIYGSADVAASVSYAEKIKALCSEGSIYGINCIFWSDNYEVTAGFLGEHFETKFSQKVVSFMPENDTRILVLEKSSDDLGDMGAIYLGKQTSNRKFRVYDSPSVEFVDRFIDAYKASLK